MTYNTMSYYIAGLNRSRIVSGLLFYVWISSRIELIRRVSSKKNLCFNINLIVAADLKFQKT